MGYVLIVSLRVCFDRLHRAIFSNMGNILLDRSTNHRANGLLTDIIVCEYHVFLLLLYPY